MISAAVVAVAACGGGSSPAEGDDASEETEEESTSVAAFFGFDPNDPDAAAANSARLNMRQQELVATCMTNQGFEYVPAVVPIDGQDFVFDEEEYARERGFGISTSTGWLTDGDGESGGSFTVASGSALEQWVDPNQAIVDALSESEREAYDNTLYGEITELEFGSDLSDSESEPTDEDLWGGGCMGEAAKEVYGGADEAFRELESLFDELQQRVDSDPRVVEAGGNWTACMADRGYDFQTVDELWDTGLDEFSNRYNELVNISNPFEGWTDEDIEIFFETQSEEAISDFYAQNQSEARQGVDQEALAALQQEERDLAIANYECGEKQREVTQEVTEELESQFIAENRDVLEQARDSLDLS